jgi:CelD/BcsL family acetyltransferase involved in cellulose biosynthesis
VVGLLEEVVASVGEVEGCLATLRFGGRLVAAHLGLRSGSTLHYWLPAYDPEFATFSPGTLLLAAMIREAEAQHVERIDLGKGEHDYKLRFANTSVRLGAGSIEPLSVRTMARRARRCLGSVRWLRHVRAQARQARAPAGTVPDDHGDTR